jgi:hypothetical protein
MKLPATSARFGPAHGARVYIDDGLLSRLTDPQGSAALRLSPDDIGALDVIREDSSIYLVSAGKARREILDSRTDPLYLQLTRLFHPEDAVRLLRAVRFGCHYFLVAESDPIMKRRPLVRAHLALVCPGLRIVAPRELRGLL